MSRNFFKKRNDATIVIQESFLEELTRRISSSTSNFVKRSDGDDSVNLNTQA